VTADPVAVAEAAFAAEGLQPRTWSDGPGYEYPPHSHPYHKVLVCTAGSITFHLADGHRHLQPGHRLDLPPGTVHSATVGPEGVTWMEAARS
jgi:quercetin dioxygenase-like cupin family protein